MHRPYVKRRFFKPRSKLFAAACLAFGGHVPPTAAATFTEVQATPVRNAATARIAYISASGYGPDRRFQLVIADPDGSHQQVFVASREPLMAPAWSPDGQRLAYVAYRDGNSAIYLGELRTGKLRKLVEERGMNGAPAWSPDGRSLAVSLSFGSNADIYIVDVESGARRRLTDSSAIDTEPSWSPNGAEIVFTSDRSGGPQIFRVSSSGGSAERMSFEGKQNMRASYSPDGRSLVLVNYASGRFRIGLLNLGTKALRILSDGRLDENPSFMPDGNSIVYTSHDGTELAMVSTAGRPLARTHQRGEIHDVACSRHPSDAALTATVARTPVTEPKLLQVSNHGTIQRREFTTENSEVTPSGPKHGP
jgi:TolB protein